MYRLFSSFAEKSRRFCRFYLVKIIFQFDLFCSSLNDDCVFESSHSLEFLDNVLDELLNDSMSESFSDDDSSSLDSLDFRANSDFTSDRWDENLKVDCDEDQWISIWLSLFSDFFDSYVDCFVVRNFNVNENSMNVNFSIAMFYSSS
jgi:hypothetical protein